MRTKLDKPLALQVYLDPLGYGAALIELLFPTNGNGTHDPTLRSLIHGATPTALMLGGLGREANTEGFGGVKSRGHMEILCGRSESTEHEHQSGASLEILLPPLLCSVLGCLETAALTS